MTSKFNHEEFGPPLDDCEWGTCWPGTHPPEGDLVSGKVLTGISSAVGGRQRNADAAAVHYYASGDVTAACVVDGIGDDPDVCAMTPIVAEVIARTAARISPLAGIMAAAAMTADTAYTSPGPDAVAVAVQYVPGRDIKVAWIGDCRAYTWDGTTLTQHTQDHTIGQQLRVAGVPDDEARQLDHHIRTTVGMATIPTVGQARIPAAGVRLVLLTSDGVHDSLTHDVLTSTVRVRESFGPKSVAYQLVRSALSVGAEAERDNTTAVVLQLLHPIEA